MSTIRIGTRGSPLALWQANYVADQLRLWCVPVLVEIQTSGDLARDASLAQIGGQGVFTKEIQRALLDGQVDVAVHSLKDLPTFAVEGLMLAANPPRGPTGDAFVSRRHQRFDALPLGAVVATSSLRRRAQALHRRPDLQLIDVRGNVETRLRKLDEQKLDGLILAEAGLQRLGRHDSITEVLDPTWMLPAVGQGALGLECRTADSATREIVARLDDPTTRQEVLAERALLRSLGGGCQVPIGGAAKAAGPNLTLQGVVLDPEGKRRVGAARTGPILQAEAIGAHLARDLLAQGAAELLCGVG